MRLFKRLPEAGSFHKQGAGPAYSHSLFFWKSKFLLCGCTPLSPEWLSLFCDSCSTCSIQLSCRLRIFLISPTRHCGHSPRSRPCPLALVSSQLSCTEDFQALSLTLTFSLGPCPKFPAAWWVFHTHPKLHMYTELLTNCYLLTLLSVNDHRPPSWRHVCLFCLFHSLSNQSLCPIDFPCSHQKDLFTHRQTHLALSHC